MKRGGRAKRAGGMWERGAEVLGIFKGENGGWGLGLGGEAPCSTGRSDVAPLQKANGACATLYILAANEIQKPGDRATTMHYQQDIMYQSTPIPFQYRL